MNKKPSGPGNALERASLKVSDWAGSSAAFCGAAGIVLLWILSGPMFHFSDTWQLVINTGTTIVTFLMVFLIQRAQNKEARAVQLKLNELIAAIQGASNRLIDAELLSEEEIEALGGRFLEISRKAKRPEHLRDACSIEETKQPAKSPARRKPRS